MTEAEPEKRVGWAELFFDLVFVFAVTRVSQLLHEDHGWAGVARAAVVFVPVYWVWVGTAVHADARDVENPADRLGIFAVGLGGLVMALAVPGAYEDRATLYAAAYLAVRLVLAGLVRRRGGRAATAPYYEPLLVSGPLLLAGSFLHGDARPAVWAVAALADLSTPLLLRRRLTGVRLDAGHLTERYGLFLIIALGESVVSLATPAATADHLDVAALTAVALAFTLAAGLWWVYFAYAADAIRHAVATAEVQIDVLRSVLSYGHLLFVAAVVAVAVGMAEAVGHPGGHLPAGAVGLLYGGAALYLAAFGYTRYRMFRLVSWTRVGAAAVVLALLPAAGRVPAVAALGLLTAAVVALNALEHHRVRRARQSG